MKISTNSFGNYSPYQINKARPAQQSQQVQKIQTVQNSANVKKQDAITNEEKKFFAKLYPEQQKKIIDYHFYQSSGKLGGVAVGSLFDKRG